MFVGIWTAIFERVARFLAGKAIGLCLGGGGARGFAHFGVIRTLQELGVPIDIIGGNSMGAYVASVYATGHEKGWDIGRMVQATKDIFSRWFLHLTPPITSMVSDGLLVHDIKNCLGDAQIEDLWLPYFCVSSNLTRAEVRTHCTGRFMESRARQWRTSRHCAAARIRWGFARGWRPARQPARRCHESDV